MSDWLTILQPSCPLSDPHLWTDSRERLNLRHAVYDALVGCGPDGRYQPALAARWSVEPDARRWTFEIREGVSFHDGSRVTAQAVVASLDRARGPGILGELGTTGLYRSYLGNAEVVALDDHRVCIVTGAPMADLLDLLVEIPIVTVDGLAGTGAYRIVEEAERDVHMEAVPRYWGRPMTFSRLRWRAEPSELSRARAIAGGTTDVATNLSPPSRTEIDASGSGRVVTREGKVAVSFMCNAQSGPCVDRRVRQALNYALDMPAIIQMTKNGAARALNGPLTPLHLGYDPTILPYPRDVERARALLAEAGFGSGLSLALDIPTTMPDEAPQLTALVAEQYAGVGISVQIRPHADRPAYAEMVKAKRIGDACCFDSSPLSTWRVLREKFHAKVRGSWWQGYSNPAVDELLDRAAATVDEAARQALYRRAYRLIHDDAPWVFLYSPDLAWGVGPRAEGITFAVDGTLRLG